MRRWLAGLTLLSLLAGCGFHLRSQAPLPAALMRPYVDAADRYSALYAALVERLRAAGAEPAVDAAGASAVIRVHVDRSGRELLTVAADNRPGEYEVYYAAEFSVSVAGKELLPRQQVRLTRDYGYDVTAVLAKEHEEQSLRAALADEIAALMLRRFSTL
jgi:LPS-assembly lipoprotein